MLKKVIFVVLTVLCSSLACAQLPVTLHLTEKDGLPDLECYKIIQDQDDYIWLASNSGLYRYNGEVFSEYKITDQKGRSVFGVSEDEQGTIWCNNLHGQILYTPKGQDLKLFKDLNPTLKGHLAQLHHMQNNLIVIWEGGILSIDKSTANTTFKYTMDILYSQVVDGKLYFITLTGDIYKLVENELLALHKSKPVQNIRNPYFIKIDDRLAISYLVNGERKINIIDESHGLLPHPGFDAIADAKINQIRYLEDELWFATNHGIFIYRKNKEKYLLEEQLLAPYFVTSLLKDKDDNYWISTLRNGVFLIPNITLKKMHLDGLQGSISSIIGAKSYLVLATTKGEIVLMDQQSKKITDTFSLPKQNAIGKIFYDPFTHTVIISINGEESYKLDLETKKLFPLYKKYNVCKDLAFINESKSIYLTYNKAVLYEQPRYGALNAKTILTKRPYSVVYDHDSKNSYIAYIDELIQYDSIWNPTPITYKDRSLYLSNLEQTTNGIVWGTSNEHGLIGIKNKKVVKKYGTNSGLLSTNIQNLKSDGNILWITSQKGIQRIDTDTDSIKSITQRDGIPNNLGDLEITEDHIFASSEKSLLILNKKERSTFKQFKVPKVYFTNIKLNKRDTLIHSSYKLPYHINAVSFGFHANTFRSPEFVSYEYQLKGLDTTWQVTNKSQVTYESLPPGNYKFNIRPISSNKKGETLSISLVITRPFWQTWWFRSLSVIIIGLSAWMFYRGKMKKNEREKQKELADLIKDKRLTNLKLEILRSQMNPHFMFNALNSIQLYIVNNEKHLARTYLVKFSRLIRIYLEHGQKNEVSLAEELEALKLYLQLEKIRFEEKLDFSITVSPEIDVHQIKVPSIFIQPYVENSIKHGLRGDSNQNKLTICFDLAPLSNELVCTIKDNGIGINASMAQKQKTEHKPFASKANMERIELYNLKRNKKIRLEVMDLKVLGQQGTLVTINIPLQKH
ncbi:sensor histidine kinase [Maribacter thermophilus]|uniref:sensor histidine kinase n=1 Tax=Maribacter thermophilus TaxID=1197874 RepID=UPI00064184B7|nr:sensor histidine kinase [Maribacter thermophilus]